MISFNELLHGHSIADVPIAAQHKLEELLKRINVVRALWAKPMVVTSGFRTEADQRRINPKAMRSKHLTGSAVDIQDTDGALNAWCKANEEKLREIGLWCENRQGGWQHFQIEPFGSYKPGGTVFFNP